MIANVITISASVSNGLVITAGVLARVGLSFLNDMVTIKKGGWDKNPSLSIVFGLYKDLNIWLYYADFISLYSPTNQ